MTFACVMVAPPLDGVKRRRSCSLSWETTAVPAQSCQSGWSRKVIPDVAIVALPDDQAGLAYSVAGPQPVGLNGRPAPV
jgi:hypothetical protein